MSLRKQFLRSLLWILVVLIIALSLMVVFALADTPSALNVGAQERATATPCLPLPPTPGPGTPGIPPGENCPIGPPPSGTLEPYPPPDPSPGDEPPPSLWACAVEGYECVFAPLARWDGFVHPKPPYPAP